MKRGDRYRRRRRAAGNRPEEMYIKSREMPKHPCPSCGAILDGITGAAPMPEGTIPVAGTQSVCAYCGWLLELKDGGGFEFSRKEMHPFAEKLARNILARKGLKLKRKRPRAKKKPPQD